ncbi:MAG: hypothetical protein ABIH03_15935, partial [Pseudomonadota bacterium]
GFNHFALSCAQSAPDQSLRVGTNRRMELAWTRMATRPYLWARNDLSRAYAIAVEFLSLAKMCHYRRVSVRACE